MSNIHTEKNVWPDYLMIRDTGIIPEDGGGRIYTTVGFGYEKRKYIRADLATSPQGEGPAEGNTSEPVLREPKGKSGESPAPLSSKTSVDFALRQVDRCRNYGPEHERTENENCIVILGDEIGRLLEEIDKYKAWSRSCDPSPTIQAAIAELVALETDCSKSKWVRDHCLGLLRGQLPADETAARNGSLSYRCDHHPRGRPEICRECFPEKASVPCTCHEVWPCPQHESGNGDL